MGCHRKKFNIAIAILKKFTFLKGNKKLFRMLMVAIIFSPTVLMIGSKILKKNKTFVHLNML